MKVAIISDIHDNLANLEKCLKTCRKEGIKELICCGDVTNSETLAYLSENFSGKIMLVRGNMELYGEQELTQYENIDYRNRVAHFEVDDKVVGVCHEPFLIDKVLEREDCHIVFYGHTHKPWEETRNGVKLINPGTLGGVFSRSTYAVWDTETDEMEMKLI
jgi:hypothetical protein